VCYEWLRPHEIVERRQAHPLAYLPLGTLEWHGEQNPIGLDGLKAHHVCVMAAQRGGGLVFPTLFYGEHRESHLMESDHDPDGAIARGLGLPPENFRKGYMHGGTVFDQAQLYNALLWHITAQINSLGFKAIIYLTGHYPLAHYAKFVAHLAERTFGLRTWCGHEGMILPEFGYEQRGDHAGPWETSLMMAAAPDRVDLGRLDPNPEVKPVGCRPDPRSATAEKGKEWLELIADCLARMGRRLLGLPEE